MHGSVKQCHSHVYHERHRLDEEELKHMEMQAGYRDRGVVFMMDFVVFVEGRSVQEEVKSEEDEILHHHHNEDLGKDPTQRRSQRRTHCHPEIHQSLHYEI